MSKKKSNQTGLRPWASAKLDNKETRFIQIGDTLFFNESFNSLSPNAQMLYFRMFMEAAGKREFVFPQHKAVKAGMSSATFRRKVKELIDAGFITIKSSGRITRENNIYEFNLAWKESPTH